MRSENISLVVAITPADGGSMEDAVTCRTAPTHTRKTSYETKCLRSMLTKKEKAAKSLRLNGFHWLRE